MIAEGMPGIVVPCQGLVLGYVIAKRPPLSDVALRPPQIFNVDNAVVVMGFEFHEPDLWPLIVLKRWASRQSQ